MTSAASGRSVEAPGPMSSAEAGRLTRRIEHRLSQLAESYEAVLPLIHEAITRDAHAALGYASPGAYIADRFGDTLSRLGGDVRREVVRELAASGLSSRAIAPVVGTSDRQVRRDIGPRSAGGTCVPPARDDAGASDDAAREPHRHGAPFSVTAHGTGQWVASTEPGPSAGSTHWGSGANGGPEVTGIDGKRYPRRRQRRAPRDHTIRTAFDALDSAARRFCAAVTHAEDLPHDLRAPLSDIGERLASVLAHADSTRPPPSRLDVDVVAAAADASSRTGLDTAAATAIVLLVQEKHAPVNLPAYVARIGPNDLVARYVPMSPGPARRGSARPCAHGVAGGNRVNGHGIHTSRVCDRCEVTDPAVTGAL